jgi:hypothetical protein
MDVGKLNRTIAIPTLITVFGLGAVDSVDELQNHEIKYLSNSSIQYEVNYDRRDERFIANTYIFTQDKEESFDAVVIEVCDVMGQVIRNERQEFEESVRLEPSIPFYMRFSFDDCKECRSVRIFFVSDSQ